MVWVRSPVYFYNRNGTYYFFRAVPSDLRHRFPKRQLEVSLRTKSESKAARSAAALSDRLERYWDSLRMEMIYSKELGLTALPETRIAASSSEQRLREANEAQEKALEKVAAGFEKTASGLRYQFIQRGDGVASEKGKTVSVHYKGQLLDGTVFDSSYKRNQPIEFKLGIGQVIPGWDEGIQLLSVGDKARFVVPSDLGYGARGAGGVIPPGATLIFDVELVGVS